MRTTGSSPSRSVGLPSVASNADRSWHSVTDHLRSFVDEVASATHNVVGAAFFFLFVAIEKKKNKD